MRKVILAFILSMAVSMSLMAQKKIAGKVSDANGKPISNVSVIVKGANAGTTTASDGTYQIQVSETAKQLEFSSLGFESQTITIGSKLIISPTLESSNPKDMTEVVVTGISKVKKSQFAGAATKIDEKQLKNQPVGSFDQILQGRAPGLTALTSSGAPGTSSTLIIRGSGSIEGGSDPLYVVDGIPVEAGVFQGLNPNDFSSIDVLRDAASTSLYGSRGSAGVIVVTTKKGVSGKLKFGYSAQMGVKSKPDFGFRPMNSTELLKSQEQYGVVVAGGDPSSPTANNPLLPGFYYSTLNPNYASLTPGEQTENARLLDSIRGINTNWYDQVYRNANFSNHQITLSGGTGRTRIYSSLGMYNEEGITNRSDMKRITMRNNIDYADDKVSFSVASNFGYTKRNFLQSSDFNTSNPFTSSVLTVPYAKVYNADGSYATGTGAKYTGANQLDYTKYDKNYSSQLKSTIGVNASYKITDNITAALTSGIDFRETQSTNYGSPLAYRRLTSTSIKGKAGFLSESLERFMRGTVRPSVTYRNTFEEKHDLEVAVYGEYIREFYKQFGATGYGVDPRRPNTMAGITQGDGVNQLYAVVGGAKSQNALVSGLATARYTYNGKYTFTGSYRKDGSSKLPEANRWQGFYSVGGIWDATKEDFIKNIAAINMLRVKLSYGGSGNADNFPGGDYPYQNTYDQGNYSGLNTIYASYPGNPDMKWEKTYVTNLGLDFELLKKRLYGDINIYNKVTKDLFVQKKLSAVGGFGTGAAINLNAGQLGNKGVELSLNGEVLQTKDLLVTVFANVGYNQNKVIDLGGELPYEVGTELVTPGLPLGTHYDVKWGGVDAATGMPLYYDLQGNLTNVYDASNRVQTFGTWEAPWRGGFGLNAKYKNFDFSILFSWQHGATKNDNMEYFVENPVGFLANGYSQSSALNFWQQPGDVTSTPSPLYSVDFSSKQIHNASFVRLRDLKVGYSVPKSFLNKLKLSNASFFVQGSNLFMWTKWRGSDPEAGGVNINLSEFPNPRSLTAGLDITF